jgi:DNA-binding MarR family transcriptional regulator
MLSSLRPVSAASNDCDDESMTDAKRRQKTGLPQAAGLPDMSGLDGTVGFLLKRAQIAVSSHIHHIFAELEITAVQFSVLTLVANNPGIAQSDLAAALDVERPRMVPVLDKLQRRGLAERRQDDLDGRSRRIHLTEDGATLLAELERRFTAQEKRSTSALGRDLHGHLVSALRVLIDLPH